MIQIPIINYLFGGSLPIMGVFLTMVGLDLTTGYVKALRSHTWVSSINLDMDSIINHLRDRFDFRKRS